MSGAAVKSGGVGFSPVKKGLLTQWREDIASVFQRDPAARNVLEVLSTYPGVHAVMMHRIS
ncbi:MAG: serine O-acetyltransferase, partial [Burkholderiales bacterium]